MFDAQTEKLNESPVWVKLPGLPLQFWFDSVFMSIGNTLGKFLDFDKSFEQTDDLSVARILVSLNPREGLAEAMTLKYREMEFVQKIDYEKLPFRCHRCHKYGHLAKECPLGHRRQRNPLKVPRKLVVFPVSEIIGFSSWERDSIFEDELISCNPHSPGNQEGHSSNFVIRSFLPPSLPCF